MSEDDVATGEPEVMATAGEHLRAERERQGLSLEHLTGETRIPQRHLEALEAGDYSSIPGRTYAIGFARSYAKALGLDQREIVDLVRADMGASGPSERYAKADTLEPGDPARVPSRGLVFFSIAAIALLLAGGFMFYRTYFAPGSGPGSILTAEQEAEAAAQQEARQEVAVGAEGAIDPAGEVVFTSLEDDTWVKFYDGSGNQLMQKQMAAGETYTIPADAENPQIWTGRPHAFTITIGGQDVPKLTDKDMVMKDVPVSAEALLARTAAPPSEPAAEATPAG
ncbi:MAG: DUF4115 domain-containing protein [Erythrobacter sp.]|nr:DUF4115 domain-containing protein [Erythrobacter sp.]